MAKRVDVSSLPDDQLECRLLGHAWYIETDLELLPIGIRSQATCVRCECVRNEQWTKKGGRNTRPSYRHPPEWIRLKGIRGMVRDSYRAEYIARRG